MPEFATQLGSATDVLGAMITPALLISASGTLVLSTSNRLSRVVDRVRVLSRDAETLPDPDAPQTEARYRLLEDQLRSLTARALILRSALASLYTAIGFLVATSVGVGLFTLVGVRINWPPVALAMLGACALLWGSVLLVREGRLAIGSTLQEMSYARRLIGQRRSLEPEPSRRSRSADAREA